MALNSNMAYIRSKCLKKCNISNDFWLSIKTNVHPTTADIVVLVLDQFPDSSKLR